MRSHIFWEECIGKFTLLTTLNAQRDVILLTSKTRSNTKSNSNSSRNRDDKRAEIKTRSRQNCFTYEIENACNSRTLQGHLPLLNFCDWKRRYWGHFSESILEADQENALIYRLELNNLRKMMSFRNCFQIVKYGKQRKRFYSNVL